MVALLRQQSKRTTLNLVQCDSPKTCLRVSRCMSDDVETMVDERLSVFDDEPDLNDLPLAVVIANNVLVPPRTLGIASN